MNILIAILTLVALVIAIGQWNKYRRRRAAAINILLAKATFQALPSDKQELVKETAVRQVSRLSGGRFGGFGGEYAQFGCYAHALAHLEIPPAIEDYCYPRWYMVKNPFTDIRPSDPLIDAIAAEIRRRHGVALEINKRMTLFDDLIARDREGR